MQRAAGAASSRAAAPLRRAPSPALNAPAELRARSAGPLRDPASGPAPCGRFMASANMAMFSIAGVLDELRQRSTMASR